MSVLNKMLQDLAQRQGSVTAQAGIPTGVQVSGHRTRSRLPTYVILAAVFGMLVASGILGYWLARKPAAVTPVASPAVSGPVAVTVAPPASVVASTVVASPAPAALTAPTPTPVAVSSASAAVSPAPPAAKPAAAAPQASRPLAAVPTASAPTATRKAAAPAPATGTTAASPVVKVSPAQEKPYDKAVQAMQQGRAEQAQNILRELLQSDARHHQARQLLAGLLINDRQTEAAERLLAEGQRLNPTDLDQAMTLARLQLERGDLAAALATLQLSEAHAGTNGNYLAFKASLHQRRKEHPAAIDLLSRALATAPDTGKWLLALAVSQQAVGQDQAARASAEAALASGNLASELQGMARSIAGGAPAQ